MPLLNSVCVYAVCVIFFSFLFSFGAISQSHSFCRCTLDNRYVEWLLAPNFDNMKHWNSELYFNVSHYWIREEEEEEESKKKKIRPTTKLFNLQWHWFLCIDSSAADACLCVSFNRRNACATFLHTRARAHRRMSEMKKWNFDRDKNSNAIWFVFVKRWWVMMRPQHIRTYTPIYSVVVNDSLFFPRWLCLLVITMITILQ